MKNIFIILLFISSLSIWAQKTDKQKEVNSLIEEGIRSYETADYADAEKSFRKALAIDPLSASASYNLGRTQIEEDKNMEASHFFDKAIKTADNKLLKSKAAFNKGNIWFNKKKYEKAIEAYKTALRNNPDDEEARYNLALAQKMLKKNKKKNNKKKDKKKDKNKDKNKKDDKKKQDKKNKDQKKKDKKDEKNKKNDKNKDQKNKKDDKKKDGKNKKDDKKDGKKDKKDKKGDKKDQKKQDQKQGDKKKGDQKQDGKPQVRKAKLTPQQVKQLLVALKNKEKKTQNKIKARRLKGKGKMVKQDKDW